MKILITGSCGFIGYHLTRKLLLNKKYKIFGIDNFDNYYSTSLKRDRLKILKKNKNFTFNNLDIRKEQIILKFFKRNKFDIIFHLAAQAGVRYSIVNPKKYIDNNIQGFFNILEASKAAKIKKIFYASSSSVYGDSNSFPLFENQILKSKNLYSLSKSFNEDLASIYSRFYNMQLIGLRFFTVYGEWGRPDMMMMKYIMAKKEKKNFYLFNYGKHSRDFTYVNDVVEILQRMTHVSFSKKNEIFNICSSKTIKITEILSIIDKFLPNHKSKICKIKMQQADVKKTYGSNKKIMKLTKFSKFTSIEIGIKNLCNWAKYFYKF